MPQLHLNFTDIPISETCLWSELDDEQRQKIVEALARLMTKVAQANPQQEQTND
jgi:predicted Fe-S protein YdhL (DUF1289 family)